MNLRLSSNDKCQQKATRLVASFLFRRRESLARYSKVRAGGISLALCRRVSGTGKSEPFVILNLICPSFGRRERARRKHCAFNLFADSTAPQQFQLFHLSLRERVERAVLRRVAQYFSASDHRSVDSNSALMDLTLLNEAAPPRHSSEATK